MMANEDPAGYVVINRAESGYLSVYGGLVFKSYDDAAETLNPPAGIYPSVERFVCTLTRVSEPE